ncbi:MAG: hypothetical protein AAFO29_02220 [Actinomycetota bacterium]
MSSDGNHPRCGERQRNPLGFIGFGHIAPSKLDSEERYLVSEWFMVLLFPIVPLRRLYVSDLPDSWRATKNGPVAVHWMDVHGVSAISLPDVARAVAYRWILMPLAFVLAALPFVWVLEQGRDAPSLLLWVSIFGVAIVPIMAAIVVLTLSDRHRVGHYDVVVTTWT